MGEVNIPLYCLDCENIKSKKDVMVGSNETGGGPESSYGCKKGRNMSHYWYHGTHCPDYDDGEIYG